MRILICSVIAAGIAVAGGSKGDIAPVPQPPGTAEMRTFSEVAPPGGTVQLKMMLTQPHPISSGGSSFDMGDLMVDGVALSSPQGDATGTALFDNGRIFLSVLSPSAGLGTVLDYPFLTITMDVPKSAKSGESRHFGPASMAFNSPDGPITFVDPKPGTLTIGGQLSISGLWPGGGTWPAGTVISMRGTGFHPNSKLKTKMKITSPQFVSETEFRFALQNNTNLDQQPVTVENPDRSTVTYYSYMRGTLIRKPSREILQRVEPAFASQVHGIATVGPLPVNSLAQFTALALQNPNPGPVVITFRVQSSGAFSSVVLPSGGRIMDEVSKLLGVSSVNAGDSITINASAGVQILGIYGDEQARTVTPFLPAF